LKLDLFAFLEYYITPSVQAKIVKIGTTHLLKYLKTKFCTLSIKLIYFHFRLTIHIPVHAKTRAVKFLISSIDSPSKRAESIAPNTGVKKVN